MGIRKPSTYRDNIFVFQDFLFQEYEEISLRYAVAKYDGEPFDYVASTFDTTDPQFSGGSVVARLDYTVSGDIIILDHWEVNWRDEWPLRLTVQFLSNCVYPQSRGYQIRVNKEVYPFWVSEGFLPISNSPTDYLTGY